MIKAVCFLSIWYILQNGKSDNIRYSVTGQLYIRPVTEYKTLEAIYVKLCRKNYNGMI